MKTLVYLLLLSITLAFLLTACEQNPLKMETYTPANGDRIPLINRGLMTDGVTCRIGYNNGNIRSDLVNLHWVNNTDADFLGYRILRNGNLIKTFNVRDSISYIDDSVEANHVYTYTVATMVRTGRSRYDTLTVKTPSLRAPTFVHYSIPATGNIKLLWTDNSDLPGNFVIQRVSSSDTTLVGTVLENHTVGYEYSITDESASSGHGYIIYKDGAYENSVVRSLSQYSINYMYSLNVPVINSLTQVYPGLKVKLIWSDNCNSETGFRIYRKLNTEPISSYLAIADVNRFNATSYIDSIGLEINKTYTYAVAAINADVSPAIETAHTNSSNIPVHNYDGFAPMDFENGTIGMVANSTLPSEHWFIQSGDAYSWNHCIRSGDIINGEFTAVSKTVSVPKNTQMTINFAYKTSSEPNYDYLKFTIDAELVNQWSGLTEWTDYSHSFNSPDSENSLNSQVTFEWKYIKDDINSLNEDCAWLDYIFLNYTVAGKKVSINLGGSK